LEGGASALPMAGRTPGLKAWPPAVLVLLLASFAALAARPAQDAEPRIVFEQPVDGGYISGPTTVSIRIVPAGSAVKSVSLFADGTLGSRTAALLERVYEIFPKLKERRSQRAGTMSGGERQMLAVGRALMSDPKLLMLDEPSLGLAPLVTAELFRVVHELNEREGLTVLVVEQNANIALGVSHHAYVLEVGRVAVEGASAELREHESVRRSYLGY